MRILVTGASGYVAKFVIEELAARHQLVLFSRRHPLQGAYRTEAHGTFLQGDLTNPSDCRRAVAEIEAIAHLGGINLPSEDTFRVNTLGTYHLLEAAREAGVRRVVLASSNCALGHTFRLTKRPFEVKYLPFDEQHPSFIEDNYSLSKRINELTLEAHSRAHGIEGIGLRLNWCWGAAEIEWRQKQAFEPREHMDTFWAYVDMRDAAQAFRLALEVPLSPGLFRIFNISAADTTAGEPSSELVDEFYPQYQHLAGLLPGRATFFSWQAAHQELGYEPRHSWLD